MEMLSKTSFELMLAELEFTYIEQADDAQQMHPQLEEVDDAESDDFLPETCPQCGWDWTLSFGCACEHADEIIPAV